MTHRRKLIEVAMPLAASYWLSKKKHRTAWVEPVVKNGARASGPHEAGGREDADETSALHGGNAVDGARAPGPQDGRRATSQRGPAKRSKNREKRT